MVNIDINLKGFSQSRIAALSHFSPLSHSVSPPLIPLRINTKCLENKPTWKEAESQTLSSDSGT